jgi:hypothetical protein
MAQFDPATERVTRWPILIQGEAGKCADIHQSRHGNSIAMVATLG